MAGNERQSICGFWVEREEGETTFRKGLDRYGVMQGLFFACVAAIGVAGAYAMRDGIAGKNSIGVMIFGAVVALLVGGLRLFEGDAERGGLRVLRRRLVIRRGAEPGEVDVDGKKLPLDEVRGIRVSGASYTGYHKSGDSYVETTTRRYYAVLLTTAGAIEVASSKHKQEAVAFAETLARELGYRGGGVSQGGGDLTPTMPLMFGVGLAIPVAVGVYLTSVMVLLEQTRETDVPWIVGPAMAIVTLAIDVFARAVFGPTIGRHRCDALAPDGAGCGPPPSTQQKKKKKSKR